MTRLTRYYLSIFFNPLCVSSSVMEQKWVSHKQKEVNESHGKASTERQHEIEAVCVRRKAEDERSDGAERDVPALDAFWRREKMYRKWGDESGGERWGEAFVRMCPFNEPPRPLSS